MSMPVMSEVVLVGERRMSFVTWYCVGVHDATICVLVNYLYNKQCIASQQLIIANH